MNHSKNDDYPVSKKQNGFKRELMIASFSNDSTENNESDANCLLIDVGEENFYSFNSFYNPKNDSIAFVIAYWYWFDPKERE